MSKLGRSRQARVRALFALVLGLALTTLATPAQSSPQPPSPKLPRSFQWSSTGPLISPHQDGTGTVSVKDPSVVRDRHGTWHVFMTTADTTGDWSLAQTSFDDWSKADEAPQAHLETASAIGPGYRAAPQAFYFAPQHKWYLVYQTGLPSYSTTDDIDDPTSWSAPRNFQDEVPEIVTQHIGDGFWLDYWVICDKKTCYLFSADDNGHLYRAETTVKAFPRGFHNTKIVLQDADRFHLFEGAAVYRVRGSGDYLLMMEAIGSDGRRWYRSFTAHGLNGAWKPLADTEDNPFARSSNVAFPDGAWTQDISHGELIRAGNDQTMTLDPAHIQLLYQGMDPAAGGDYSQLPWRLALATETGGKS